MKFGPLTFQCACLQCNCRSTASARDALHSSMIWTRFVSDKSIAVAYILVLVLSVGSLARASCSQTERHAFICQVYCSINLWSSTMAFTVANNSTPLLE